MLLVFSAMLDRPSRESLLQGTRTPSRGDIMRLNRLLVGLAALVLVPTSVWADDRNVEVQVVDAMNKVFGVHPGFRAFHAKGIVVEGTFQGSPEGAALSRATLFGADSIPVTVRFSDNGGLPTVADGSNDANPHGMALKFRLPDGSETDMVTNSLKFFPVSNAAELLELFEAVATSPQGAPKPTKFEQFLERHPQVGPSFSTARTPGSFAEEEYQGLNAFVLVNNKGERQPVRYRVVPERVVHIEASQAATRDPNFLMDELPARLALGPVTFRLRAQLAEQGDQTKDPSQPWPDNRKVVELGVIILKKAVPDSAQAEKALLFLPGQITDGIELSDDPMVSIRDGAYAVSFSRRN
jgi:catalase